MYAQSHSETDHILLISWYLLGQTINILVKPTAGSTMCIHVWMSSELGNGYRIKYSVLAGPQ